MPPVGQLRVTFSKSVVQVVLGGEQEAGVQQQVPLYNVFPSPGLTITTQPGPELASPPPTLPSLLSSLDTTTTMSQVGPSAGDQVARSHVVPQID